MTTLPQHPPSMPSADVAGTLDACSHVAYAMWQLNKTTISATETTVPVRPSANSQISRSILTTTTWLHAGNRHPGGPVQNQLRSITMGPR